MKTQTLKQTSGRPVFKTPAANINYTDLSRGAAIHGFRAQVLLEKRVLEEFGEWDPTLGHNTAGVVLAVLLSHLADGNGGGDDRLTVYLIRRSDHRPTEVDLMLLRRQQDGGEHLYLRVAGIREISDQAQN